MRKKQQPKAKSYRIGYGKPPKRFQFKKGRSGNPKGRKKGSRNRVYHRLAMDKLAKIMQAKSTPAALQIKVARILIHLSMQAG